MSRVLTRLALAGSGTILGLIGSALLASPRAFLETSGILVDHDPGLMSELSAPAGILLVCIASLFAARVRRIDPIHRALESSKLAAIVLVLELVCRDEVNCVIKA